MLKELLELESIDVPPGQANISFLKFLVSPPVDTDDGPARVNESGKKRRAGEEEKLQQQDSSKKQEAREAYTALQILDATPREILDLWTKLRLRQPVNTRGADNRVKEELLPVIEDCARRAIEEQSFLSQDDQDWVRNVFSTRHYYAKEFDMSYLELNSDSSIWIKHQGDVEWWIREHRSWRLSPSRPSEVGRLDDSFRKLPPRPMAWMILLHDLAWIWNNQNVSGNLVERFCKQLTGQLGYPSEVREYSQGTRGWAVWSRSSSCSHLPLPAFKTFFELDRFLFIWRMGTRWMDRENESDYLALWALAGWTVLVDAYPIFAKGIENWYKSFFAAKGSTFEIRFEAFQKGKRHFLPQARAEVAIKDWFQVLNKTKDATSPKPPPEMRRGRKFNL